MIEEVLKDIYKIEIPLPRNPLRAVNSYVIKAPKRNLIIDTGLNREECMDAMRIGLSKLGVNLRKTDFYITHSHADHFGLVSSLATESSKIYFNKPDAEEVEMAAKGGLWDDMGKYARLNGFPEEELKAALNNNPGHKYGSKLAVPLIILKEGDTISIGEYLFKGVATPGHTRGHMCLYEPDKRLLVSGDHILGDVTPNIQSWSDQGNPLYDYLASLDKVYELDVEVVLPGHRGILKNFRERVRELKKHHKKRAEEVLSILKKGSRNAFQVALEMKWNINAESWDLFPAQQKLFATGEAMAHLKYLVEKGMITKEMLDGKTVYSLNGDSGFDRPQDSRILTPLQNRVIGIFLGGIRNQEIKSYPPWWRNCIL